MSDAKKLAPVGWLESLAISEAQLAEGKTVPAEPIFQRLKDSIAKLEAMQTQTSQKRKLASRR